MEVVFTDDMGIVKFAVIYNTIENIKPVITIDRDFFSMLAKKVTRLSIKNLGDAESSIIYSVGSKKISIQFCKKQIWIIFTNCHDIAGQVYIENYVNVTIEFINYGAVNNISEFPVLDQIVKNLQIYPQSSIGEDCTYFNNLSSDLESLKIVSIYNVNCNLNNLPVQLQSLYIRCDVIKYPIESIPTGLKCLKLNCKQYNFRIDFPPNLEHCEIYCDDYSHGLANIPDSVVVLGISYYWIKDIEKLPKKCKMLGYSGCPSDLYNALIKRKLKVHIVKYEFARQIITNKIHNCCICEPRKYYIP